MSLALVISIFFITASWIVEAQRGFETCEITNEQDCNYSYLKNNLPEGKIAWIVKPGGDTKCLDGSPYGFQVFPGDTDKLMLWFQGGGVCYNYQTCLSAPLFFRDRRLRVVKSGIFDMNLEDNPLVNGEWTTVINNYCTGDMFIGDITRDLTSPDESRTATVYHYGYKNTLSVLNWIQSQPEFGPGQEMAVGGCSTGALGVQAWATVLADDYGFDKFQLDSFIAFFPLRANIILQVWDSCTVFSKLSISVTIARQCNNRFLNSISPIFGDFLEKNPDFPVAYTGTTDDTSQILNYALFSNPGFSGNPQELVIALGIATTTFTRSLWNTLTSYKQLDENFSDYIVEGSGNCYLGSRDVARNSNYNSPYSRLTMLQYFGNFLNRDVYDGSPDYPNGFPFNPDPSGDDPSEFPFLDYLKDKEETTK